MLHLLGESDRRGAAVESDVAPPLSDDVTVDAVRSRTTNGEAIRFKYEPVQLELMGRRENFDVIEIPESVPNLLGQVPLEVLDLVVDTKRQKLIPNPAHGGKQMTEEY